MKAYCTVCKTAQCEYTVNKSRFITVVAPVATAEEAMAVLAEQKRLYPDATHHCWAYVLMPDSSLARYSDDGEPGGTAGPPILEVLKRQGITNTVCVVTRYFGGILLGAGGLTRTYGKCAALGVEQAGKGVAEPTQLLSVTVPYQYADKVKYRLEMLGKALTENTDYGQDVTCTLAVRTQDRQELEAVLVNATNGMAIIKDIDEQYRVWKTQ